MNPKSRFLYLVLLFIQFGYTEENWNDKYVSWISQSGVRMKSKLQATMVISLVWYKVCSQVLNFIAICGFAIDLLESKQSFHLIILLCTFDFDSDSVVTENQCLVVDHFLYSCDLKCVIQGWYSKEKLSASHSWRLKIQSFIKFSGPAHVLSAAQNLRGHQQL